MAWQLDLEDLEIGELEDLAEVLGIRDIRELGRMAEAMPPRMMSAVAWLAKRREDPAFTIEDARRMKVRELEELFGANDPNAGGGVPAASSVATTLPSSTSMAGRSPRRRTGS